jgi:hypothetical protein
MRFSSILIILMFIGFGASAQVYQNMAQPGYKFGRARFDSVLTIPTGLGAMRNITGGQDTGQIRFNVSDSSVYVWNGRRWVKPVGGGVSDTLKVSVSDTAAMLANYAKTAALALKVNISDTAAMLSPYVRAASLTIPTLTQVLEAAPGSNEAGANQIKDLSAGTSQNDAATFGQLTDTANLRLRISDTASMLSAYARSASVTAALALKLNISDTSAMLRRYLDTLQAHNTRIISAGGGGGGSALSALTAATSSNTIDNSANNQTWQWNTLGSGNGLTLSSTSTAASGNTQSLFNLSLTGTNANAAQSTYAARITNARNNLSGFANNFALYLSSTGSGGSGVTNNALFVDAGAVVLNTNAQLSYGPLNNSNTNVWNGTRIVRNRGVQEWSNLTQSAVNFRWFVANSSTDILRLQGTNQVGIGTSADVNASAILAVESTTRGLLIPRMTLTQRNAIASPAAGLQVIVTGETGGEFVSMYNSSLAAWVNATSKWSTNANGINYNGGNVGIGTALPYTKLDVSANSIGAAFTDYDGIALQSTNLATVGAPKFSPSLILMSRPWNTSTSASDSLKFRIAADALSAGGSNGSFIIQAKAGAAAWSSVFAIRQNGNITASGSHTFGSITLGGLFNSGPITNTRAASTANTNINNISADGNIAYSSGTNTYTSYLAANVINTTGTNSLTYRGFYFNPTLTSITGSTIIGFQNTSGNNLFGTTSGSVGIGANTSIAASAILDVTSTTQGVLFPRMTTVQKLAIGSPAAGLQVYDTTLNQMSYFNGTTWVNF